MTTILGIDPGASGGIALVSAKHPTLAAKMPATERDIWDTIKSLAGAADFAYIEAVHSAPGQGVASSFKFGRNYGFLRACLMAAGIPWEGVSPHVWQRPMGCIVKGRKGIKVAATAKKNHHKGLAQQLFPDLRITHAIADALLIAEYGRRERSH